MARGQHEIRLGSMMDVVWKEGAMCLTCGCMQAHLQMGEHNITYEDVKAAADENGRSVAETLDIVDRTVAIDRGEHAEEYAPSS
jgi:hypothetical protein